MLEVLFLWRCTGQYGLLKRGNKVHMVTVFGVTENETLPIIVTREQQSYDVAKFHYFAKQFDFHQNRFSDANKPTVVVSLTQNMGFNEVSPSDMRTL